MALKGDCSPISYNIANFMNEVAERGGMTVFSTFGSGIALDQSRGLVTYSANPSGKVPAGILMNDMVNVDQAHYQINKYKDEVNKGGKVTLIDIGWVVTNKIEAGDTLTVGQKAYLGNSGLFTNTFVNTVASPPVGRFDSTKDENGYARVYVNLPYGT